jgi:hypothetical protein
MLKWNVVYIGLSKMLLKINSPVSNAAARKFTIKCNTFLLIDGTSMSTTEMI